MTRGYKRRNYFINQELQGKMILMIFLMSVFGVALFTLIFCLLSTDHLTIAYAKQQFRVGNTPSVLIKELFQANWLFILMGGGVVSVLMLFVSHAFAGPLYRFEAVFKGLNNRDLNQHIQLRAKDIGQSLVAEINEFSKLYSADLHRLQELSASLADKLQKQQVDAAKDDQREISEIINRYNLKPKG
ncbi:MAG: methyl-accepting chemotaxis protein [Deltaproteobacteria bacterium]|nr:methyl-accepting chemotaxis protein [Deltaproteobacteria bacterium]